MSRAKRVMLKLSGEALAGEKKTGFDEAVCLGVAAQVKQLCQEGVQVAIVIGGGNFWRGRASENMDRTKADQIGMLATVMNCIYVSEMFRSVGLSTQIYTPFAVGTMTRLFTKDEAIADLEAGSVVFLAGGTGHPYFSTDTAVVLRSIELEAQQILLAKAIDGVYDRDPKLDPAAKRYEEISIQQVVQQRLAVIDLTASILCMENHLPMLVFSLDEEESIVRAAHGTVTGTRITAE